MAIVVPDEEALQLWASKPENGVRGGAGGDHAALCNNPVVNAALLAQMNAAATEAQLKGFERAKAIHLEPAPFSVENGMLTPTFKLKRAPARDHYRPVIDAMYAGLNAAKL